MLPAKNAACPCGSGKKFKRCCGAPGAVPAPVVAAMLEAEGIAAVSEVQAPSKMVPVVLFALSIGVGVGVGTWRDAVADGLAVGLALCVGVVMYLMSRNPPESSGRGGGASINFGLNQNGTARQQRRSTTRSFGPPSRRSGRRK